MLAGTADYVRNHTGCDQNGVRGAFLKADDPVPNDRTAAAQRLVDGAFTPGVSDYALQTLNESVPYDKWALRYDPGRDTIRIMALRSTNRRHQGRTPQKINRRRHRIGAFLNELRRE